MAEPIKIWGTTSINFGVQRDGNSCGDMTYTLTLLGDTNVIIGTNNHGNFDVSTSGTYRLDYEDACTNAECLDVDFDIVNVCDSVDFSVEKCKRVLFNISCDEIDVNDNIDLCNSSSLMLRATNQSSENVKGVPSFTFSPKGAVVELGAAGAVTREISENELSSATSVTITMDISTAHGNCTKSKNISINEGVEAPVISGSNTICKNENVYLYTGETNKTVKWYTVSNGVYTRVPDDDNVAIAPGALEIQSTVPGSVTYVATNTIGRYVNSCTSDYSDPFTVTTTQQSKPLLSLVSSSHDCDTDPVNPWSITVGIKGNSTYDVSLVGLTGSSHLGVVTSDISYNDIPGYNYIFRAVDTVNGCVSELEINLASCDDLDCPHLNVQWPGLTGCGSGADPVNVIAWPNDDDDAAESDYSFSYHLFDTQFKYESTDVNGNGASLSNDMIHYTDNGKSRWKILGGGISPNTMSDYYGIVVTMHKVDNPTCKKMRRMVLQDQINFENEYTGTVSYTMNCDEQGVPTSASVRGGAICNPNCNCGEVWAYELLVGGNPVQSGDRRACGSNLTKSYSSTQADDLLNNNLTVQVKINSTNCGSGSYSNSFHFECDSNEESTGI